MNRIYLDSNVLIAFYSTDKAEESKRRLVAAAMSAVRTSTPFEPLPDAFHGPNIELRFIYMHNLPTSNGPTPNAATHSGDCDNYPPADRTTPRLVPLAQPPDARICDVN
ncbi:MAG: hypothetical protein WB780_15420 [Candidatus Acidiferrales bacterium]